MSIIYKGLNPKNHYGLCILTINGELITADGKHYQAIKIPTPHGDLIDRDIVRDECYKTMDKLMQSTSINISAEALSLLCGFTMINEAPTILEAEE